VGSLGGRGASAAPLPSLRCKATGPGDVVAGSGNGGPATVAAHADGGARERRMCA
jgi:hypothetical protein